MKAQLKREEEEEQKGGNAKVASVGEEGRKSWKGKGENNNDPESGDRA